ncbi:MAG: M50 family metallopeptidase [Bacteroidota bacterium]
MKNSILTRMIGMLIVYFALEYFGGSFGRTVLYPINQLVTFLHEFGHALGAILTGGSVEALQVNEDGSGFTITRGGNRGIVLMGGYIGSALFGNLLFYIGARKERWAGWTLNILAGLMIFSSLFWFNSLYTSGFLIAFAIGIYIITSRTSYAREVLMFLGLVSILYIIQDFNVGPSSDLNEYAKLFVVIPATVWMYIWLFIALLLSFMNLRMIFKEK